MEWASLQYEWATQFMLGRRMNAYCFSNKAWVELTFYFKILFDYSLHFLFSRVWMARGPKITDPINLYTNWSIKNWADDEVKKFVRPLLTNVLFSLKKKKKGLMCPFSTCVISNQKKKKTFHFLFSLFFSFSMFSSLIKNMENKGNVFNCPDNITMIVFHKECVPISFIFYMIKPSQLQQINLSQTKLMPKN